MVQVLTKQPPPLFNPCKEEEGRGWLQQEPPVQSQSPLALLALLALRLRELIKEVPNRISHCLPHRPLAAII